MAKGALILALALACVAAAHSYTWTSCGTRYDRLIIKDLDFFTADGMDAGNVATIRMTGDTDLHVPLVTGGWQVRVYELGEAKSIYTTFGDLSNALHFTDALNTTFEFKVNFTLPAPLASNQFTASLMATDQAKAMYCCVEVMYALARTAAPIAQPEPLALQAPDSLPEGVVVGDAPHFWSCGKSSVFDFNGVTLNPPTPAKGKKVTISAHGTSMETISGGKVEYKAKFDGIQLISKTQDLCTLLGKVKIDCPVKAGPLDIAVGFNVPSWAPSGNYSAIANAYDQDNNLVLCMQGYFVLA